MLILRGTTDSVQVITGSAADIEVMVSAMDASDAAPPVIQAVPNLGPLASITTATTTTIVAAPGSSLVRNVKQLSLVNNHASASTTCIIQVTDGTNTVNLWNGVLLAGESVVLDESGVWTPYTSGGVPKVASFVGPADVQVFTAHGTWTKPTAFTPKVVIVELIGAGGGGGGGGSLATAVVCKGGGGGGGGAWRRGVFAASDLGSTVSVTIGTGGTAGASGSAGAAGGDGGVGGNTTFGTHLTGYGGGGGRGGAISAAATGGGGGAASNTGGSGGASGQATNGSSTSGASSSTASNTATSGSVQGGSGGAGAASGQGGAGGSGAGDLPGVLAGAKLPARRRADVALSGVETRTFPQRGVAGWAAPQVEVLAQHGPERNR